MCCFMPRLIRYSTSLSGSPGSPVFKANFRQPVSAGPARRHCYCAEGPGGNGCCCAGPADCPQHPAPDCAALMTDRIKFIGLAELPRFVQLAGFIHENTASTMQDWRFSPE